MIEMTKDTSYSQENEYYTKVDLVDGVFSDAIRIPGGDLSRIVYYLKTTGNALMQVTLSTSATILLGTAEWIDISSDDEISPAVSAVRGKSTGADGILEIRCQ